MNDHASPSPPSLLDAARCADLILERVGRRVVVGTPLGLGKANVLLNELFRRASEDRSIELVIITALTLEVPRARSDLEARFLDPISKRLFDGYVDLDYASARRKGALPDNIRVHEFFMAPGKWLNVASAQRDYISSNYTHVARDMLAHGVNVVVQMVSPGQAEDAGRYSLSCNPDVTLDLVPRMRAQERPTMVVGEINDRLPFMLGDAAVESHFFDALCTVPNGGYTLFGPPRGAVSLADHAIGLHASTLIRDAGTLQVGIGSMGDAVVNALLVRHENNALYRRAMADRADAALVASMGGMDEFDRGLYGATEMLVDGFVDLFDRGVLKRRVYDDLALQRAVNAGHADAGPSLALLDALVEAGRVGRCPDRDDFEWLQQIGLLHAQVALRQGELVLPDGNAVAADLADEATRDALRERGLGAELAGGAVAHGGFFLGPPAFYERLRKMPRAQRALLPMTSVSRINQLYGDEALDQAQRGDARFINSCLKVTLGGAVVSDGLEDGRVLSGVGGQYNFVAMAHALPGGRSIIMARATRRSGEATTSNIVFGYGHVTVPRHLRDIVVTEYGVADLRGRTDAECAMALIAIADARFQDELVDKAKRANKLPADFRMPETWRRNTPASLHDWLGQPDLAEKFPPFPLGTELTDDEIRLGSALKKLKAATGRPVSRAALVLRALMSRVGSEPDVERCIERMRLANPQGWQERLNARLLRYALTAKI